MSDFNAVPEQVWDDLQYEIERNELEYADNFRAYRVSDDFLREAFDEAERSGCCGFFQTHTVVDSEKWIIGCNYGH